MLSSRLVLPVSTIRLIRGPCIRLISSGCPCNSESYWHRWLIKKEEKRNNTRKFRRTVNQQLIQSVRSNGSNGKDGQSESPPPLMAFTGFVTGILSLLGWEEDILAKEDPFILTIKRGIFCMQREEYDKAEIILHAALTTSVTQGNEKATLYIYSLLGNNAFLKGEYQKSEKIYKDVIVKLLHQGIDESHEAIIEISLKLATIYSKMKSFDKADIGFRHCLSIQGERARKIDLNTELDPVVNKEEINTLALYGLALDWYSKHLLRKEQYQEALKYTLEALNISEKISGTNAHQTMVLLSDAGALLNLLNNFDEANDYFQRAIRIGTVIESDHLKTLYYNMGMNNIMRRQWSAANQNCNNSFKFAKTDDDKIIMKMAEECLRKAKAQEA